jgi:anti-anti-sigma factor
MKPVLATNEKNFLMEDRDVTVSIESTLSVPHQKIIAIRGTVDRDTSFRVNETVLPLIEQEKADIILDLSHVDYLSSFGVMSMVKYLVICNNKKNLFKLVNPPKSVHDTMVVFGISNKFDIYMTI